MCGLAWGRGGCWLVAGEGAVFEAFRDSKVENYLFFAFIVGVGDKIWTAASGLGVLGAGVGAESIIVVLE